MSNPGAMGAYIGGKDKIDETAVIMQQLLTLGIHLSPLPFVQLCPCLDQQFVEPRIFPKGFVLC